MTTMAERRAAAAVRIKEMAAALVPVATKPDTRPRIRVYMGGIVTALAIKIALGIETAAQTLERWAESKQEQHTEGSVCPHCSGTGRYRLHTQAGSNGKCFRCHGKGRLDTKDLAFLARRGKTNAPICWVTSA